MGQLDHWNPVLASSALREKPVGVKIAGQEIVVFRTESGEIGALDDVCIHRRMRLSCGYVEGNCITCPYHGWTFTPEGHGTSPGTPKRHGQAVNFEAREAHGVVWVKSAGSVAKFPEFAPEGYYRLSSETFVAEAPIELVLDNFCELEHSATTHVLFGYDLKRLHEMQCDVRADDEATYVTTVGPHKKMMWIPRTFFGLKTDGVFTSDWVTRFSPVQTIVDHSLADVGTGRPSRVKWRIAEFFTPIDDRRTLLTIIVFTKSSYWGKYGWMRFFKPIIAPLFRSEIHRDLDTLKNLADKNPDLDGMKLSRFDKVLALNRERLDRIYRGIETPSLLLDAFRERHADDAPAARTTTADESRRRRSA